MPPKKTPTVSVEASREESDAKKPRRGAKSKSVQRDPVPEAIVPPVQTPTETQQPAAQPAELVQNGVPMTLTFEGGAAVTFEQRTMDSWDGRGVVTVPSGERGGSMNLFVSGHVKVAYKTA
eukprot:PhF_6_TR37812/c0_g1_i1/m.56297